MLHSNNITHHFKSTILSTQILNYHSPTVFPLIFISRKLYSKSFTQKKNNSVTQFNKKLISFCDISTSLKSSLTNNLNNINHRSREISIENSIYFTQKRFFFHSNTETSEMNMKKLYDLNCAVLSPQDKHESTVIWLHGLGDNHEGFADIFETYLKKPTMKVILPNAPKIPITINGGYSMPGWYDITSFSFENRDEDKERMLQNAQKIANIVQDEINLLGDPKKVLLGGFSQGGALSLLTCFGFLNLQLAGVISCSGYWLLSSVPEISLKYKNNTPIAAWHGRMDPVVPYQLSLKGYDLFKKAYGEGLSFDFHDGNFQHTLFQIEIIKKWIHDRL